LNWRVHPNLAGSLWFSPLLQSQPLNFVWWWSVWTWLAFPVCSFRVIMRCMFLALGFRVLMRLDQSNASEAFGWSRSIKTLGLDLLFAGFRLFLGFLAICTMWHAFHTPVHPKFLLKIPKNFLRIFDYFLDIFMMLLCVKSWLKICVAFFLLFLLKLVIFLHILSLKVL
jgi:hypothetical protein